MPGSSSKTSSTGGSAWACGCGTPKKPCRQSSGPSNKGRSPGLFFGLAEPQGRRQSETVGDPPPEAEGFSVASDGCSMPVMASSDFNVSQARIFRPPKEITCLQESGAESAAPECICDSSDIQHFTCTAIQQQLLRRVARAFMPAFVHACQPRNADTWLTDGA